VTHASVTGSIVNGADGTVPNEHGLPLQSPWAASAQVLIQPNDYFLATVGVVANDARATPTGSMVSMGFNWAQLDLGYRDHWFSPMTDTSMMIGTEAATMPSATLSNYEPLTRLGLQYEFFLARMSSSNRILYNGQGTLAEGRGNPKLAGAQFSIEPFSGWSLGVNQLLQYGGAGLDDSANTLLHYFFKPAGEAQTKSNHQASYISRFIFPARTPFAVYAQYAGEDNSNGGSYLLGNTATSVGIDFPLIARNFDLTYEVSEWQNFWYTNSIFLDGMVNHGNVIGAWGGDQRVFNDGVGARSQMLRLGWTPPFGGYLEERVRTLINQNYGQIPYSHYLDVTVRYSRPWKDLTVGGEVLAGRDVFGKSFSRISGFVRYGGLEHTRSYDSGDDDADEKDAAEDKSGTELFVDVGANANKVKANVQKDYPVTTSKVDFGPHFALGARRAVSDNNDLGVRIEFDEVQSHTLIGFRPLDYRYRIGEHLALDLFVGVARYALETPAYSVYAGAGAQWRDVLPKWDLGVDFRYAQNVARDHVLATDPAGVRAESFYKIESGIAYISRRF
jgi:Capsule assembly protein Wzi